MQMFFDSSVVFTPSSPVAVIERVPRVKVKRWPPWSSGTFTELTPAGTGKLVFEGCVAPSIDHPLQSRLVQSFVNGNPDSTVSVPALAKSVVT